MLGVQIAVDDFGAGYSALAYLPRLPLHLIKLDRQFVSRLGVDQVDRAIVKAVAQLTRELRIDTVAEGVETATQARALVDMGYTKAQGYLFSPPVEYPEMLHDLAAVEQRTRAAALAAGTDVSCAPSPHVLLVDDDSGSLEVMRTLLEQYPDLRVEVAATAATAIEHMSQDWPADLIITDLQMQPANGVELARAIRCTSRGRAISVVAVTAYPEMLDRPKDRDLFDEIIGKPIHPETFAATIHALAIQSAPSAVVAGA
jgi:CheY-like chemotaxis protein